MLYAHRTVRPHALALIYFHCYFLFGRIPGLEHNIGFLEYGKYLDRDLHDDSDDRDEDEDDDDSNNDSDSDDDNDQEINEGDAAVGVREVDARPCKRAKLLDNLLVNLSSRDVLNLGPYRRFGRLLEKIFVFIPELGEIEEASADVDVLFDCNGASYFKEYAVPHNGTAAEMACEGPSELGGPCKDLLELPSHVLRRVYEYATATPSVVIFDLDSRSVIGIDLRPLQINKTLRLYQPFGLIMAQTKTITLRSSTTERSTSFGDFAALRELFQTVKDAYGIHKYGVLGQFLSAVRKPDSPLVIELHFNTATDVALCYLETNIKGLVGLLCHSSSVVIRIFLTCAYNPQQTEVFDLDVDKLRVNLFFVLVDMFRQWPAGLKSKKGAKLLSVWINGRGSLMSVTCSNSMGTERFTA